MYLRAAKSELEDAGESADGCADSVSELRSELKALTGVDIMADAAGTQFKSTYQIIKELSKVYGTLSDVTKANVTEMIGGKRNANVVSALLEGFDTAESALASATSNITSAWDENEIYLDSIQGKISQLDAAFQSLSTHILNSEVPKFFISVATAITKGVDALVEFNGAIPSLTFLGTMATQLGRPKMTGFMIVPSNTLVATRNERTKSVREYLAKPTNMVIIDCEFG